MMVAFFAMLGLFFTGWALLAKPFMHNFNESLVFFSLRTTVSQKFFQFSVAFYGGISVALLALLSVQFVYRFLTISKPMKNDGSGGVLWLMYPAIPGLLYYCSFFLFCTPDRYADSYVRTEILQSYALDINTIPRFTIISYNSDGSLRFLNLCFLIQWIVLIGFHYFIIILFGIKTHFQLKKKLHEFSSSNSRIHTQIFKALIIQILVPTLIFILPGTLMFSGPYLDTVISLRSGWLLSIYSTFPIIDCVLFMIIVTEYKKTAASRVVGVFKPNAAFSAQSFTIEVRARAMT